MLSNVGHFCVWRNSLFWAWLSLCKVRKNWVEYGRKLQENLLFCWYKWTVLEIWRWQAKGSIQHVTQPWRQPRNPSLLWIGDHNYNYYYSKCSRMLRESSDSELKEDRKLEYSWQSDVLTSSNCALWVGNVLLSHPYVVSKRCNQSTDESHSVVDFKQLR